MEGARGEEKEEDQGTEREVKRRKGVSDSLSLGC